MCRLQDALEIHLLRVKDPFEIECKNTRVPGRTPLLTSADGKHV